MKKIRSLLVVLPILLTACTSSKLTSSWKDPGTSKELSRFKNILVIGMQPNDRQLKEQMENQLTEYLKREGITAKASFDEYGPKAFAGMSEDAITDHLKAKGYDGIITIALLDKSKEQDYVPGRVNYTPIGTYYNRFSRYFTTVYDRVYTPSYYTTSTNYFWETNLYDARQDKIIYSAQSQSFDPNSVSSMSKEHGKLIVKDLEKNGFISSR